MTGDVNGSSDLRSVPSGLSHARRAHRESRALHKSLPKGTVPRCVELSTSDTLAGSVTTKLAATVEKVAFPEFFKL